MGDRNYPTIDPVTTLVPLQPLSEEEIEKFLDELDANDDNTVDFNELERKLEDVHKELAPQPRKHHLNHPDRQKKDGIFKRNSARDIEKGDRGIYPEHDGIHAFLCSLMPDCEGPIPKDKFMKRVRHWNIPSQKQNAAEDQEDKVREYSRKMTAVRRGRAYWAVKGPKIVFISFVIMLQLAFGLWQLMEYVNKPLARAAFGWGVIVAKGSAGVLYPTLFFMVLSMSRWFATACRRFYYVSRFVDWDRHQSFHIWMACAALFFASTHAIGHLTGTFLYGSRPAQQDDLARLLGPEAVPRPYVVYVRSLPGWSGIVSLGLFWMISLLSMPKVRKWSYEVFQVGHLLMFPMLGLLAAHGTAKLLQFPMLGFWLVIPTLLVIAERTHRLYRGFVRVPAKLQILDDDTVTFTCRQPEGKPWRYSAGQYVFLQVPSISRFQWHSFTISACRDDEFQLHIKTDGDWTERLRSISMEKEIYVGIDGPFGAPAQRFYEYDQAIIIGAGVGITPFSAILTDLEQKLAENDMPWRSGRSSRRNSTASAMRSRSSGPRQSTASHNDDSAAALELATGLSDHEVSQAKFNKREPSTKRRVDFHWMVREKNYLLWFSDLLNRAHDLSETIPPETLDLNIYTHVTMKRKNISTHIFRYLLDGYRTRSNPVSALTGLKSRSEFGRPDFELILEQFYEDVRKDIESGNLRRGQKVGVFFCGTPVIGEVLSDICHELTIRGRHDGTKIRWDFRIEVFG